LPRLKALPLDSPNWMTIAEAHRLLCSLAGSRILAAKDLTDAMADEDEDRRLPAMRRCFMYGIRPQADGGHDRVLVGPERELLPRAYWTEHEVQSWSDATFVTERSNNPASLKGYAYFVWKPALAKRWPAVFPSVVGGPAQPPQRRKPGPKTEGDWDLLLAAELIRIALDDRRRGVLQNTNGLVRYMCEGDDAFLKKQLGWAPRDREAVRKKIVILLQFVPR
jgi:hypothetical protein